VRSYVGPACIRWPDLSRHGLERARLRRKRTIEIRMKWRSSVSRAVDDVDAEAFLQQTGDPAWTAVRRPHPVQALAATAVHEDHRVRMTHARRNPVLDVHLPTVDHRPAREMRLLDA